MDLVEFFIGKGADREYSWDWDLPRSPPDREYSWELPRSPPDREYSWELPRFPS